MTYQFVIAHEADKRGVGVLQLIFALDGAATVLAHFAHHFNHVNLQQKMSWRGYWSKFSAFIDLKQPELCNDTPDLLVMQVKVDAEIQSKNGARAPDTRRAVHKHGVRQRAAEVPHLLNELHRLLQ